MKIKLPKPTMRDPNALDAKSRKAAGAMKDLKKENNKNFCREDIKETQDSPIDDPLYYYDIEAEEM